MAAARAVERLFKLVHPPENVGDPKSFMIAATETFAAYPAEVWDAAIGRIVGQTSRPTLDVIKAACEAACEPLDRRIDRKRHQALPAPARAPRTSEEQARADEQIAELRRRFGISGGARTKEQLRRENDGKHFSRIAADLEARKLRNQHASLSRP